MFADLSCILSFPAPPARYQLPTSPNYDPLPEICILKLRNRPRTDLENTSTESLTLLASLPSSYQANSSPHHLSSLVDNLIASPGLRICVNYIIHGAPPPYTHDPLYPCLSTYDSLSLSPSPPPSPPLSPLQTTPPPNNPIILFTLYRRVNRHRFRLLAPFPSRTIYSDSPRLICELPVRAKLILISSGSKSC